MNVQVYIEHLLLDGLALDATHGLTVQAAVEAELARLFAASGQVAGLQQDRALGYLRGADIRLCSGRTPDDIGRQIAHSLHEGFDR